MSAIFHQIIYKFMSLLVSIAMLFGIGGDFLKTDSSEWNTNYKYVFVHGLSGWGSYDSVNKLMPYWGMFGGDLMQYLNDKGFDCYAASVAPTASAWDRACELYAQLTGTVTDYGKAHSEKCNHERYGEDFTGRALIDSWSEEDKINLLGHSFGGATVRLFASMLETGNAEEIAITDEDDLSDFFKGGKGSWVYSITTLAAPSNGTTAYNTGDDNEQPEAVPEESKKSNPVSDFIQDKLSDLMSTFTGGEKDGRIESDYASYDMYIDNALELNKSIITYNDTYYFAIPCSATEQNSDGTHSPIKEKMESLFISSSEAMGKFTGVTKGGFVIDETWQENDGLVNTISAMAPSSAPSTQYEEGNTAPGVWNVMPIYYGDHMSLQGGLTKINDVKDLYVEHLSMINSL